MTSDCGRAVFVLQANAVTDFTLMLYIGLSFMHTRRSAAPRNAERFLVSKFFGNGLKMRSKRVADTKSESGLSRPSPCPPCLDLTMMCFKFFLDSVTLVSRAYLVTWDSRVCFQRPYSWDPTDTTQAISSCVPINPTCLSAMPPARTHSFWHQNGDLEARVG